MSIADNVIDENIKLGTARTLMREKLQANGIYYNSSDSVIRLVGRWNLIYADISFDTPSSGDIYPGAQITVGATVTDPTDDSPIQGLPVTVVSGGRTYNLLSGSDGVAAVTLTVGVIGSVFQGTVYAGKDDYSWSFEVPAFPDFNDYAWDYNTGSYDIVKYPAGLTHTFEVTEVSYNEYYNLSKQTAGSSVVMAIPKVYTEGIDAGNGIHMEAAVIQKKDSNQGWGDAIALVGSKSLSHYRDTKILELGAYPGKKGLKYSNSDHVVRDVNVTTGQLSLDSQKYYFNLWFDKGYVKATITHGTVTDFTYEGNIGDKITFDTFYPAIMIYDAGGHIQWENMSVEPWTREE